MTAGARDARLWSIALRARRLSIMSEVLTADDLLPLIAKLAHDQRVRLAKLALYAAASEDADAAAYRAAPPSADEFSDEGDPLAWEGEGWEEFGAAG